MFTSSRVSRVRLLLSSKGCPVCLSVSLFGTDQRIDVHDRAQIFEVEIRGLINVPPTRIDLPRLGGVGCCMHELSQSLYP